MIGMLAPNVARALSEHRRLPALLSLPDRALVEAVGGTRRQAAEDLLARFDAEAARRCAAAVGLWSVCRHRDGFPRRLLDSGDGPCMLYVAGDPKGLARIAEEPTVAVVGSRRASPYGLEVAAALSRELGVCRVPVVSGMALGVDSAAHEGALASGGLTVAVQAAGADVAYPRARLALHGRIARDGLVVSEMPPGFRPFRWSFPARNRIMAALTAMTVVVEGTDRSGSLITARFAADLGREVGAVPGQVTAPLAAGPNALIADGACVVRTAADVLEALYGPGTPVAAAVASAPKLDRRLETLLGAVERGCGTVDAVAGDSLPIKDALAGLTELEMMGLVRRAGGGLYVRCR
jgi:DNA processing protein